MYDKVQKEWRKERDRVEREFTRVTAYDAYRADDVRDLQRRHERLMTTDMAVVVSPGQNEIEHMRALGIDVAAPPSHERRRPRGQVQGLEGSVAPRVPYVPWG